MRFRITHIDHHGRRRQVDLDAAARSVAEQLVLLMYGPARYLSAICLRRRS